MALVTPVAQPQNAFDANNTQRFFFTASGGDQVYENKLTIRRQSDNSVVYENRLETYSFYQDVPAETLINGVQYNFYFNTYDRQGNISENSNVELFWCYTNPTIIFTNIPTGNVIPSVSYNFKCTYNQIEGEFLESLRFELYNINGTIINSSNTIYSTEAPPNNFEYTFSELEETRYYVEVVGLTVNGTEITSGRIQFNVEYSEPVFYEKLKLKNNANDGNINVYTNLIAIDGYSNKSAQEQVYIDNEMLVLDRYLVNKDDGFVLADYVMWKSGFSIPNSFVMQILMKPCLIANIMTVRNDDATLETKIGFKREIPDGESTVKDCFYIRERDYINNRISVIRSNYVDLINNNSYVCLWIKKVGTTWDLKLDVLSTEDNVFNWNSVTNVEYNRTTDFAWGGESYSTATDTPVVYDSDSLYPITSVKIYNGIFDNIYITKDTDLEYTSQKLTEWNNDTILCCKFDNTINAGNISVYVSQISSILIKRRASGETSWLTILNKVVGSLEDININVYDYFCPNHTTMEYAIVPIVDGAESSYIISSIYSCFNGVYVTDGNETYKLYEGVVYGNNKQSLRSGIHEPLNGIYPIIAYNSKLNYKSFTIEGFLLGYEFDTTRKISRKSVINEEENMVKFLTNKKMKILKDWNGNIYLGSVVEDITPTIDLVNGYEKISFNMIEQGKYNNQTDYNKSGLVVK